MKLGHAGLIVVGLWTLCVAPKADVPGPQSPDTSLVDGVRRGDWKAIRKAAASGDASFIPLMRELTERSGKDEVTVIARGEAHMALAKLGDVRELQERWCAAVSDAPAENDQRILGLGVGGWFSIYGLSQFLKPELRARYAAASHKYWADKGPSDVVTSSLEQDIIFALQEIVPHPPFVFGPYDAVGKVEANAWLHWITLHERELRALKPTGEGVDMSLDACAKGSKKD